MIPFQFIMGIGCVVIAAAAAVYFSMSNPVPPHQTHRGRRPHDNDDDDDDNNDDNDDNYSRPGDKCIMCLEAMTRETMRTMHCGHALHEIPCYRDYRKWRRQCPYCNQLVLRIDLPDEDCVICCEPMLENEMEYLKCEHALHTNCLATYIRNNFKKCPKCSRPL
ncbi:hypothetical protein KR044_008270 [Drosophila immigrans]|nr:hypothetical protein KR044_008270 [Drosophila immigrans]